MEQTSTDQAGTEQVDVEQPDTEQVDQGGAAENPGLTPGDLLRSLPTEAQERGTRVVSAQAMQARLFSVYDAAAAAEDALAMVQQQLTLTLNRSYYEADEIQKMAEQLDSLLALDTVDRTEDDLIAQE